MANQENSLNTKTINNNNIIVAVVCIILLVCIYFSKDSIIEILNKYNSIEDKSNVVVGNLNPNQNEMSSGNIDLIIQSGDVVKVDYVGSLDDGKIFDTSIADKAKEGGVYNIQRTYEPLKFTVGGGNMIKGFDEGVVGMKKGETRKLVIQPKDGYGESRPELMKEFKVGDVLPGQYELSEVKSGSIVLDLNPPLAGKDIKFEITIVSDSTNPKGPIQKGDKIKVDYVGYTIKDGKMFDTSIESKAKEGGVYNASRPYQPLEFTVGGGQLIKGFDEGVIGMKIGEKKTIDIPFDKGYGPRDPSLIKEYFKDKDTLNLYGYEARISSIGKDSVILDFNHKLAGKVLTFDVTIVDINRK